MLFKLAFKNIKTRPWRSVATILAIALAVAMIFCMFSFKEAVYEYIYQTEIADAGNSDIVIKTKSNSDRVTITKPLKNVEGIKKIVPTLNLFALYNEEYVKVKGIDFDDLAGFQKFKILKGNFDDLSSPNNIAISKRASKHFNLDVGSKITLALGNNQADFFVVVVADNDGYFLSDSPFTIIGGVEEGVSKLLDENNPISVYNEIYIQAEENQNVDKLIGKISAIPIYQNMKVGISKDAGYIKEQTTSLTAPIVLAGAAVLLLGMASVMLLFMMSEKDKIKYISQLSVVGATKKQLFCILLAESFLLAFIGAILGSLLASGIFYALLKITLSTTVTFKISFLKLFGSAGLGVLVAVISSIIPLIKSLKGTVRENEILKSDKSLFLKILPIALILITLILIVIEFTLPNAKGVLSIVNVLLSIITLGFCLNYILNIGSKISAKINSPSIKIASLSLMREKRFANAFVTLTIGMLVSMLLFMAYTISTNVFNSYLKDFKDMVFITNVQSDIDASEFKQIDGVESATALIWKTAKIDSDKFENKSTNIIGSTDVLDMLDFKFITDENLVRQRLLSNEKFVFLDYSLTELYGVCEGDKIILNLDDKKVEFVVGGVLRHRLLSGNYLIMNEQVIENNYDIAVDTVLAFINGDNSNIVGEIRTNYADKNYYVVEVLEAYRWESQSLGAVFDLIGILAVVISIFIFLALIAGVVVSRSTAESERSTLICAGMSKNTLLKSEIFEHGFMSLLAFVFSFAISVLLTASFINALRLFGLYFEFMYETWIIVVVGICFAVAYTLLPIVLRYKKGYTIRKD